MTSVSLISDRDGTAGGLRVERAIADFRSGYPVVLEEGSAAFLAQSIDSLGSERLAALQAFADGKARLVLSSARLRKLAQHGDDIGCIALPNLDREQIEALAVKPDYALDQPLLDPQWADRVALELARLTLVLPAVIVIPLVFDGPFDPHILRVAAEDIRRYRRQQVRSTRAVSRAMVPLEDAGSCEFIVFRGGEGLRDHVAIVVGKPDLTLPVFVRLHSACLTGDLFGSLKCDCGDQLRSTVRHMAQHDGGIVLYLDQEGRGNGIANKIRAYHLQAQGFDTYDADEIIGFDKDQRRFDFAADMLRQLGGSKVRLMTNNPLKIQALVDAGIDVVSDQRVNGRRTLENAAYLDAKRVKAGHLLDPQD